MFELDKKVTEAEMFIRDLLKRSKFPKTEYAEEVFFHPRFAYKHMMGGRLFMTEGTPEKIKKQADLLLKMFVSGVKKSNIDLIVNAVSLWRKLGAKASPYVKDKRWSKFHMPYGLIIKGIDYFLRHPDTQGHPTLKKFTYYSDAKTLLDEFEVWAKKRKWSSPFIESQRRRAVLTGDPLPEKRKVNWKTYKKEDLELTLKNEGQKGIRYGLGAYGQSAYWDYVEDNWSSTGASVKKKPKKKPTKGTKEVFDYIAEIEKGNHDLETEEKAKEELLAVLLTGPYNSMRFPFGERLISANAVGSRTRFFKLEKPGGQVVSKEAQVEFRIVDNDLGEYHVMGVHKQKPFFIIKGLFLDNMKRDIPLIRKRVIRFLKK